MLSVWLFTLSTAILSTLTKEIDVPKPHYDPKILNAADVCFDQTEPCYPKERFSWFSGKCNNVDNPSRGKANTALGRLVQAAYADGVHEPRKSTTGQDLPNARSVVTTLFGTGDMPDDNHTLAFVAVAQLMTHDISYTKSKPLIPDSRCCCGGQNCLNVNVQRTDPFYGKKQVHCLPMSRADTTASVNCSLTPEYLLSRVSHYVDASFLYGVSEEAVDHLRVGGHFITMDVGGYPFPPDKCSSKDETSVMSKYNIDSGDGRTGQNAPLTSIQIIALREHNRIADELLNVMPDMEDDETLFLEARRVLIAEWQIIVFRDWIPLLIGMETAQQEEIVPFSGGKSAVYNKSVSAIVTHDFSAGVFRILHGLIPSMYCTKTGKAALPDCKHAANYSEYFDRPEVLLGDGELDAVLTGLATKRADKIDGEFSQEISGKMFRSGESWGMDLIAGDLQRGRDAGLPSYNVYRELCGLKPAKTWDDLTDTIDPKHISGMRKLYSSVDDLDLYTAVLCEKKFPGSLVGPISQCIIVDQFKRLKIGDRFFVDHDAYPHALTPEQQAALRATSLSRWMCDNGNDIKNVAENVFLKNSVVKPCNEIPSVDFSPWKTAFLSKSG